jgi:hypothetical protein
MWHLIQLAEDKSAYHSESLWTFRGVADEGGHGIPQMAPVKVALMSQWGRQAVLRGFTATAVALVVAAAVFALSACGYTERERQEAAQAEAAAIRAQQAAARAQAAAAKALTAAQQASLEANKAAAAVEAATRAINRAAERIEELERERREPTQP